MTDSAPTEPEERRSLSYDLDVLYEKQRAAFLQVRRSVADLATVRKRIEMQLQEFEKKGEDLDQEAEVAPSRQDEDFARSLLSRRTAIEGHMDDLNRQMGLVEARQQSLISTSQHLQTHVEHFRMEKDLLSASYAAAEALTSAVDAVGVISALESFVAEELRKLAELRDAGVLTQGEFESQKAKLLT